MKRSSPRFRAPALRRWSAALGGLLLATGIAAGAALATWRTRAAPPLAGIEFAGCSAVTRAAADGVVCELAGAGTLRLWLPGPLAQFAIRSDRGAVATTDGAPVLGGTRVSVAVPADARELRVDEPSTRRRFRLPVRRAEEPAWLRDVQQLREAGRLAEARARLEGKVRELDRADRARAVGLLARVDLAGGDLETAVREFRDAIARDREAGLVSAEADDRFALAYTLDQRLYRYAEARAALADARLDDYPEGRARQPFYEGLLIADTQAVHAAVLQFHEAEERAERLGMTRLQRNARSSYALYLAVLGQRSDALAMLRDFAATADDATPGCDRVDLLDAVGIWTLRSLDVAGVTLEQADRAFDRGAALYPRACADVHRHAHVLLGLGEVALRRGETALARARLDDARRVARTPQSSIALAASVLEARLALADGAAEDALARFAALENAPGATLPEWRYAIALGRGQAYEALRRPAQALAAYEDAEATVNDQSLWIPLGEGRASFLADREEASRLRLDLLLRAGRVDEAVAVARASRARPVDAFQRLARIERLPTERRAEWERAIEDYRRARDALEGEAADAWKWSAEHVERARTELSARNADVRAALDRAFSTLALETAPSGGPAPGDRELVVAYHPTRDGWVGFGLTSRGATAFRFALPPPGATPETVAERLLGPLRDAIAQAKRVRFLPYGPLRAIDFHALPWEAGLLLDRVAVTYGFDLPERIRPAPGAPRPTALLVADPTDDLPRAKREAAHVARALGELPGWSVRALAGEEATRARVREALTEATLFHYAGHGSFRGRAGIDSALALAEGGSLTVGDVLTLPRAPALVVLAGCETARSGDDAGEGLGLAHAFIAAGSRSVVAPIRPVADALAEDVSAALYAALRAHPDPGDAAEALREALRTVRRATPDADWAAFRLIAP